MCYLLYYANVAKIIQWLCVSGARRRGVERSEGSEIKKAVVVSEVARSNTAADA